MTTDEDVKEAERSFLVKLLTDKRLMGLVMALLVALCMYLINKLHGQLPTESSVGSSSTWICTGCTPNKPPSPPPAPSGTGGNAGTGGASSTGGSSSVVVTPLCPQGFQTPHYSTSQIEKWKRTLGPKLQPPPKQLFEEPSIGARLGKSFFRSLLTHSLDQGPIGSCTGNAMVGCVSSLPFQWRTLTETDALNVYKLATKLDPFPGTYPPTDTGSDGASACKALVQLGFAKSCFPTHASLTKAGEQLQTQGITWGVNWHSSSYQLLGCGELAITGGIDGGHQMALVGVEPVYLQNGAVDPDNSWLWGLNSWGDEWGLCIDQHCGYYRVRWRNAQTLVNEGAVFDGPNL